MFKCKSLLASSISLALVLLPTYSNATSVAPDLLCPPKAETESYIVGFFNGVGNTWAEAVKGTDALTARIGEERNGQEVYYETFYNHSGKTENDGATVFQDFAEVFVQRAEEIEPDLGSRFEIFWSAVSGDADGFLDKISDVVGATSDLTLGLMSDLYTEITTESLAMASKLLSNPPTESDYGRHHARITSLAAHGNKLLLVAHSQGNLFVGKAYNQALKVPDYSSDNIGVVHIAPASSITKGPHVLADIDLVINALRGFGMNTVPDITVDLPKSHLGFGEGQDSSGHKLIETYLNPSLAALEQVKDHCHSELDRLATPVAIAEQGSLTATLVWNGAGDVDLHTYEPTGSHVYYSDKAGVVGYLDVDNRRADGPEHYYASCDASVLESGTYQFGVNNYNNADGRSATVQISTPYDADLITKTITLGAEEGSSGNENPEMMITVDVSRDEDGNITISAI